MTQEFDPYLKWLAIPAEEQPPNHYRLLGVPLFISDLDVIENAADQKMGHVRTFGTGKHATLSQRILNEISTAKMCLLQPESKLAYDAELRLAITPDAIPFVQRVEEPSTESGALSVSIQTEGAARTKSEKRRSSNKINIIGHIIAPIVGIALGILILNMIMSEPEPELATPELPKPEPPGKTSGPVGQPPVPKMPIEQPPVPKTLVVKKPVDKKPVDNREPTTTTIGSDTPQPTLSAKQVVPTDPYEIEVWWTNNDNHKKMWRMIFHVHGKQVKTIDCGCGHHRPEAAAAFNGYISNAEYEGTTVSFSIPSLDMEWHTKDLTSHKTDKSWLDHISIDLKAKRGERKTKKRGTLPSFPGTVVIRPLVTDSTQPTAETPPEKPPEIASPETKVDARLPIPGKAAQDEADKLVQEVFGDQINAAIKPDAKLALTKELLEESAAPDTSPAGRYAMLQAALHVAPDTNVAMSIIDNVAEHFQIDELDELTKKASTVWKFSNEAKMSSQRRAVADTALQLVDESVERDAYDTAMKLADIALKAAQKTKDWKLVRSIRAKALEVKKKKADFDKVQEAETALQKNPADANANLTVGKYKCFVTGDWESGLQRLARGSDKALKDLAEKDLKKPATSNDQVAMGDDWYDLAEKPGEANKERMLQRADFWYQSALNTQPPLTRLVMAKVEDRRKKIKVANIPEPEFKPSKTVRLRQHNAPDAVKIGDHYYKVVWQPLSWNKAKAACENVGGYLACCETTEERIQLGNLKGPKKVAWVGGYRDRNGKFSWLTGKEISRGHFQTHANLFRYPYVAFNVADTLNTREESGKLSRAHVQMIQGFICEWDE